MLAVYQADELKQYAVETVSLTDCTYDDGLMLKCEFELEYIVISFQGLERILI